MKLKKKTFRNYIFTVVIPTIFITGILSFYQYRTLVEGRVEYAENRAKFLSEKIDSFVLEITSNLELLANLIDDEKDEYRIQHLLTVMGEKYPYAKEFYYVNTDRIMYLASNTLTEFIDIHFRHHFNTVMATEESALFFAKSALNNYKPLITVATPVFRSGGEISGVLIGDISPQSILNHRPALESSINYILGDNKTNKNILDTFEDSSSTMTASKPLEKAPWTVTVNVDSIPNQEIILHTFIIFFICVLIAHLLYFIIRFMMRFYYEKKNLEAEEQKNAMKKLELVGTLAGTFAHEVRNPLTGIMGFVTLLKEKHPAEEDQMYFSVIETELTRINNIVGEFLILGKPITVKKTYDIKDILQEVYLIIESEAHHCGVSAKMELADEPLLLFCTKDHIKQIVLNLAKNAIQASQAGDQVTISAHKNKGFIVISVSDNGSGISEEDKETLFDPFFTTKEEGTGLGLIVCKQIVEMYQGTIEVDSTLNIGTTFFISFPIKKK